MDAKAISLFTSFNYLTVLYRANDGEYFIEEDDVQAYIVGLGAGSYSLVNRVDPLPEFPTEADNSPIWVLVAAPVSANKALGFDGCISFSEYALDTVGNEEVHATNRVGAFSKGQYVLLKARSGAYRAKYGQITGVNSNNLTVKILRYFGPTDTDPIDSWEVLLTGMIISAYDIAVAGGYTGTPEEWVYDAINAKADSEAARDIVITNAMQVASDAAATANNAYNAIQAANNATSKALEANTAATLATTKAVAADNSANNAAASATQAQDSSVLAVSKASEATTKAAEALAAKLSAESYLSALTAIDGDLGSYNAATNSPALTATPSGALADGQYYTVTVGGAVGFAGDNFASGEVLNIGDKLQKIGAAWYRQKFGNYTGIIPNWTAQSWAAGVQVNYDHIIWKSNADTLSTDIPGISENWENILNIDNSVNSLVIQKQTLGTDIVGTSNAANSAVCYLDFSVFSTNGSLKKVKVNATIGGDVVLVQFRKNLNNVWLEIRRETLTVISGKQTIDLSGLNITYNTNDTFGLKPGTSNIKYLTEVSGKGFLTAAESGGVFSFTNANFPNTPSGDIAMDFEIVGYYTVDNRLIEVGDRLAEIEAKKLDETNHIGNTIAGTTQTSNAAKCYVDFSVSGKSGVLKTLYVNAITTGNVILVQFRNTSPTIWGEIARYTVLVTAGINNIDVSGLGILVAVSDTFGLKPGTSHIKYAVSQAGKGFLAVDETGGVFGFTNANFPNTPSGGIAMQMQFGIHTNSFEYAADKASESIISGVNSLQKFANQEHKLWNSYTRFTVKKDGTGDYTNIQTAINAAVLIAKDNDVVEIAIFDDWEALDDADYSFPGAATYTTCLARIGKNIRLRGIGGRRKLFGTMPTDKLDPLFYDYTQVVYVDGGGDLETLHLTARNIRYPIHSDGASNANSVQRIIDCIIEHEGCDDVPNVPSGNRWHQPSAWGGGTYSGQILEFLRTTMISPIYPFSNHSNVDFSYPAFIRITECRLINSKHGYSANIQVLGSGVKEVYEFVNNFFSGAIKYTSSYHTSNIKNDAYSLIAEVKGGGNTPHLFDNQTAATGLGQVLKITSNATGSTSKVVVMGGTAKDLIFGNSRKKKNGGGGLSGYDSGSIELYYGATGGSQLWNQALGHRLGDCSIVNKTLLVTVDGVAKTVTFDKDYKGPGANTAAPLYTNAAILLEITTALGTATASTYSVVAEYYPEWNDLVESRANSSTSVDILAGMGVMFVGGSFVRKATLGEKPDGIALDDILPGSISGVIDDRGRILKKAILQKTDRFQPLWDGATPTLVAGDKVRIGTTDGLFIQNSTGVTAGVCEMDLAVNAVVVRFI